MSGGRKPGQHPSLALWVFLVKNAQVAAIPGIKKYLDAVISEKPRPTTGYLRDKGLIPLPAADRHKWRECAMGFPP